MNKTNSKHSIMSCFWDGLRGALAPTEWDTLQCAASARTNVGLASALKRIAETLRPQQFDGMRWNGEVLQPQLCRELLAHVKEYSVSQIPNGYDCSSCDAFLCLCTVLLRWDMTFVYCGVPITYKWVASTPLRVLTLGARIGHFYGLVYAPVRKPRATPAPAAKIITKTPAATAPVPAPAPAKMTTVAATRAAAPAPTAVKTAASGVKTAAVPAPLRRIVRK
jgi:hypothetical protein